MVSSGGCGGEGAWLALALAVSAVAVCGGFVPEAVARGHAEPRTVRLGDALPRWRHARLDGKPRRSLTQLKNERNERQ